MAGQPTCRLRDVRARASFDSGQILPGYRASAFISAVAAPASADGLPYSEGFGDVGGPLWAYDPGDNGVPPPINKGDANHHPLYAFGYGLTTR
jgi:hypothetical protein